MGKATLQLTYTLTLELPAALETVPEADLAKTLDGLLGNAVHQGLRTVVGRRLAGAGVRVTKLTHQVALTRPRRAVGTTIPKERLVAAAPHLTDAELADVEASIGNVPFLAEEELHKRIRARALKRVNEVRLVPVKVVAEKSNGERFEGAAALNITHGALFFPEELRSLRFKANAPVQIYLPDVETPLVGVYRGSTLGGPVVEIPIEKLAPYRDQLLAAWQANQKA